MGSDGKLQFRAWDSESRVGSRSGYGEDHREKSPKGAREAPASSLHQSCNKEDKAAKGLGFRV